MKATFVATLVMLAIPLCSVGQQKASPGQGLSKADTCELLAKHLAYLQKDAAVVFVKGLGDDSAARETLRQVRLTNNHLQRLQALQQMQSFGCRLPSTPILELSPFVEDAMACEKKRLALAPTDEVVKACDFDLWRSGITVK